MILSLSIAIVVCISIRVSTMRNDQTAKLFMTGRSQAVRLPREFRFEGREVYIRREGDSVVLTPRPSSWDAFFDGAPMPSDDFMNERDQGTARDRGDLFE